MSTEIEVAFFKEALYNALVLAKEINEQQAYRIVPDLIVGNLEDCFKVVPDYESLLVATDDVVRKTSKTDEKTFVIIEKEWTVRRAKQEKKYVNTPVLKGEAFLTTKTDPDELEALKAQITESWSEMITITTEQAQNDVEGWIETTITNERSRVFLLGRLRFILLNREDTDFVLSLPIEIKIREAFGDAEGDHKDKILTALREQNPIDRLTTLVNKIVTPQIKKRVFEILKKWEKDNNADAVTLSGEGFYWNPKTTVINRASAGDTTLMVENATVFKVGNFVEIGDNAYECTDIAGKTLTIFEGLSDDVSPGTRVALNLIDLDASDFKNPEMPPKMKKLVKQFVFRAQSMIESPFDEHCALVMLQAEMWFASPLPYEVAGGIFASDTLMLPSAPTLYTLPKAEKLNDLMLMFMLGKIRGPCLRLEIDDGMRSRLNMNAGTLQDVANRLEEVNSRRMLGYERRLEASVLRSILLRTSYKATNPKKKKTTNNPRVFHEFLDPSLLAANFVIFEGTDIVLKPVDWVRRNLYFKQDVPEDKILRPAILEFKRPQAGSAPTGENNTVTVDPLRCALFKKDDLVRVKRRGQSADECFVAEVQITEVKDNKVVQILTLQKRDGGTAYTLPARSTEVHHTLAQYRNLEINCTEDGTLRDSGLLNADVLGSDSILVDEVEELSDFQKAGLKESMVIKTMEFQKTDGSTIKYDLTEALDLDVSFQDDGVLKISAEEIVEEGDFKFKPMAGIANATENTIKVEMNLREYLPFQRGECIVLNGSFDVVHTINAADLTYNGHSLFQTITIDDCKIDGAVIIERVAAKDHADISAPSPTRPVLKGKGLLLGYAPITEAFKTVRAFVSEELTNKDTAYAAMENINSYLGQEQDFDDRDRTLKECRSLSPIVAEDVPDCFQRAKKMSEIDVLKTDATYSNLVNLMKDYAHTAVEIWDDKAVKTAVLNINSGLTSAEFTARLNSIIVDAYQADLTKGIAENVHRWFPDYDYDHDRHISKLRTASRKIKTPEQIQEKMEDVYNKDDLASVLTKSNKKNALIDADVGMPDNVKDEDVDNIIYKFQDSNLKTRRALKDIVSSVIGEPEEAPSNEPTLRPDVLVRLFETDDSAFVQNHFKAKQSRRKLPGFCPDKGQTSATITFKPDGLRHNFETKPGKAYTLQVDGMVERRISSWPLASQGNDDDSELFEKPALLKESNGHVHPEVPSGAVLVRSEPAPDDLFSVSVPANECTVCAYNAPETPAVLNTLTCPRGVFVYRSNVVTNVTDNVIEVENCVTACNGMNLVGYDADNEFIGKALITKVDVYESNLTLDKSFSGIVARVREDSPWDPGRHWQTEETGVWANRCINVPQDFTKPGQIQPDDVKFTETTVDHKTIPEGMFKIELNENPETIKNVISLTSLLPVKRHPNTYVTSYVQGEDIDSLFVIEYEPETFDKLEYFFFFDGFHIRCSKDQSAIVVEASHDESILFSDNELTPGNAAQFIEKLSAASSEATIKAMFRPSLISETDRGYVARQTIVRVKIGDEENKKLIADDNVSVNEDDELLLFPGTKSENVATVQNSTEKSGLTHITLNAAATVPDTLSEDQYFNAVVRPRIKMLNTRYIKTRVPKKMHSTRYGERFIFTDNYETHKKGSLLSSIEYRGHSITLEDAHTLLRRNTVLKNLTEEHKTLFEPKGEHYFLKDKNGLLTLPKGAAISKKDYDALKTEELEVKCQLPVELTVTSTEHKYTTVAHKENARLGITELYLDYQILRFRPSAPGFDDDNTKIGSFYRGPPQMFEFDDGTTYGYYYNDKKRKRNGFEQGRVPWNSSRKFKPREYYNYAITLATKTKVYLPTHCLLDVKLNKESDFDPCVVRLQKHDKHFPRNVCIFLGRYSVFEDNIRAVVQTSARELTSCEVDQLRKVFYYPDARKTQTEKVNVLKESFYCDVAFDSCEPVNGVYGVVGKSSIRSPYYNPGESDKIVWESRTESKKKVNARKFKSGDPELAADPLTAPLMVCEFFATRQDTKEKYGVAAPIMSMICDVFRAVNHMIPFTAGGIFNLSMISNKPALTFEEVLGCLDGNFFRSYATEAKESRERLFFNAVKWCMMALCESKTIKQHSNEETDVVRFTYETVCTSRTLEYCETDYIQWTVEGSDDPMYEYEPTYGGVSSSLCDNARVGLTSDGDPIFFTARVVRQRLESNVSAIYYGAELHPVRTHVVSFMTCNGKLYTKSEHDVLFNDLTAKASEQNITEPGMLFNLCAFGEFNVKLGGYKINGQRAIRFESAPPFETIVRCTSSSGEINAVMDDPLPVDVGLDILSSKTDVTMIAKVSLKLLTGETVIDQSICVHQSIRLTLNCFPGVKELPADSFCVTYKKDLKKKLKLNRTLSEYFPQFRRINLVLVTSGDELLFARDDEFHSDSVQTIERAKLDEWIKKTVRETDNLTKKELVEDLLRLNRVENNDQLNELSEIITRDDGLDQLYSITETKLRPGALRQIYADDYDPAPTTLTVAINGPDALQARSDHAYGFINVLHLPHFQWSSRKWGNNVKGKHILRFAYSYNINKTEGNVTFTEANKNRKQSVNGDSSWNHEYVGVRVGRFIPSAGQNLYPRDTEPVFECGFNIYLGSAAKENTKTHIVSSDVATGGFATTCYQYNTTGLEEARKDLCSVVQDALFIAEKCNLKVKLETFQGDVMSVDEAKAVLVSDLFRASAPSDESVFYSPKESPSQITSTPPSVSTVASPPGSESPISSTPTDDSSDASDTDDPSADSTRKKLDFEEGRPLLTMVVITPGSETV
jgi:hypothetical protein